MIHQYKNNGYNIVMDINSGSVHVVDETVYELLPRVEALIKAGVTESHAIRARMAEGGGFQERRAEWVEGEAGSALSVDSYIGLTEREADSALSVTSDQETAGFPPDALISALDEILTLYEAGMLFSPDVYEDYIKDFKKRPTVVKALCLHIAHDCNLACRYCFAEEGEYHGHRALMSLETGKKALDFLVAASGSRVNLEVDFFGGEPLMNWEVVKELVKYGRSLETSHHKKFRFTLTTNGILLNDEIMEFVNAEMSNLVLSIDGRKEVNDRMRPHRGGQGSYEEILPCFLKAAASRGQTDYYVRGTFTRHNLDFAEDVLHLADLGFRQISVEPVVAAPEADGQLPDDALQSDLETDKQLRACNGQLPDYALRTEDVPVIFAEYDRLAREMIARSREGRGFSFFHFMIDLTGGPCVAKRLSGCGAGSEYLAVTPWGDFYPCHQFVGREEFLLGNVDTGIVSEAVRENFKATNVYTKDKCRQCFARFYCSGGCAANSYSFHGRIDDAYDLGCELQRKRVECAIMIKAAQAESAAG